MEGYVTQVEYQEHNKRMDDEHERTNARLKKLEEDCKDQNKLLLSIEKIAINVENMQKELAEQGKRLMVLENRDGEMWRKVVTEIIKVAVSLLVGFAFAKIGIV